jgi:hypothetical protein
MDDGRLDSFLCFLVDTQLSHRPFLIIAKALDIQGRGEVVFGVEVVIEAPDACSSRSTDLLDSG